jgi:anti-sigma-K factor RskA
MKMSDRAHIVDLLPAYLNRTLNIDERTRVDQHLRTCAACRTELDAWRAVAASTTEASSTTAPPSPEVLLRIHTAIDATKLAPAAVSATDTRSARYLWQLLLGQIPLVRHGIWIASALTTLLGVVVALLTAHQSAGTFLLALVAPVVAAVGIAFIYGPENDPSLEIAVSTPTSPRMVLLSRMTLVFGYDLLLALAASLALTMVHGLGLWQLIELWFAPMLFLSALTLATSLLFSPLVAMTGALALWGVRLFAISDSANSGAGAPNSIQQTLRLPIQSSLLLGLGLALFLFAVIYVPRQDRFPLDQTTG